MRSERCTRCPDEDTDKCNSCQLVKDDMEIKLTVILKDERERIGGKPIDKGRT
jgi:hypothetical protein